MTGRSHAFWLAVLALLALAAYAPMFSIPLLEDDYPNLWQSLQHGSPAAVPQLLQDPVFRLRATSFWTMDLLWQAGKTGSGVYHLASLVLHILNTWLLYGVCLLWPRMRPAAFWAAAFFAIAEGHQEAVMWFSAINELLLFLFGMAAFWCWLQADGRPHNWSLRLASIGLFLLALLSKESAVILLPLFLLTGLDRAKAIRVTPLAVLGALAIASVIFSRDTSFRFSDGSFSLHAPFWMVWPRNYFRVLWIWGLPAAAAVLLARDRALRLAGWLALAWIGIALLPYSFLTYSTEIPSRQTYLASAGLAMLFGLAVAHWQARLPAARRPLLAALLAIVLLHNVGYLWIRKRRQFLERAAPTEQLIALARHTSGTIWVRCFPRNHFIAEEAVDLAAGFSPANLIWDEADAAQRHPAAVFCYQQTRR